MKIGIFTDYYLPMAGGTEISTANYKAALEALGHEVIVFTADVEGRGKPAPQGVVYMPTAMLPMSPVPIVFDAPGYSSKIAKNYKLDIVHSQTQFGAFWVARDVAKKLNVPHVATLHSLYKQNFKTTILGKNGFHVINLLVSFYQTLHYLGVPRIQFEPMPQDDLSDRLLWRWLITQASIVDSFLVPAHYVAEAMQERGLNRAIVQPNIVITGNDSLDPGIKKAIAAPKGAVRFVSCSLLRPEKRINVLISAFARLPKNLKWQLVLVGDGSELDSLKKLAAHFGVADKVIFLGRLSNPQAGAVVRASDVSVLVSTDFDLQPMTLLESVASGVPVLYCDKVLARECGLNSKNSLLSGPSTKSISNSLTSLVTDKPLLERLKTGAKAHMGSADSTAMAKKLVAIYKDAKARRS